MNDVSLEPLACCSADALTERDALLGHAYRRASFAERIVRLVAIDEDAWLLARDREGVLVAAAAAVAYPRGGIGWIGFVATHERASRRGLATRLTRVLVDRLERAGCTAVLDASPTGAPVYERLGFLDVGSTHVLGTSGLAPRRDDRVRLTTRADHEAIAALDRLAFGADRGALLGQLLAQSGRVLVHERDGVIDGFAIAQRSTLGPVVAAPAAAVDLVAHACTLAFDAPPSLAVPPSSAHLDALLGAGCTIDRSLRQMLLPRAGVATLGGARHLLVAQASLAEG
jgi:predicted N-acetyltransferase YhbS